MTASVTVIIPWRGGCQHREGALKHVLTWWETHHPDWDVRVGEYPEERGPWCKGLAVRAAQTMDPIDDDSIVIVSDADVICEEIHHAVNALQTGGDRWLWAMPHNIVTRLSEWGTAQYVHGDLGDVTDLVRRSPPSVLKIYKAYPGGGMVALRDHVLNRIPIDPRFLGYGQEDHSWSLALHRLAGAPWRDCRCCLIHLWHPPQSRMRPGIGSVEGLSLWHRYRSATTPEVMRSLVEEARMVLG